MVKRDLEKDIGLINDFRLTFYNGLIYDIAEHAIQRAIEAEKELAEYESMTAKKIENQKHITKVAFQCANNNANIAKDAIGEKEELNAHCVAMKDALEYYAGFGEDNGVRAREALNNVPYDADAPIKEAREHFKEQI